MVNERIAALLAIANQRQSKHHFTPPEVLYFHDQTRAGWANARHNQIGINCVFLAENREDMIHHTVAHEVAHIVVGKLWTRAPAHGREWQAVMRQWFKVEPRRCHSYDTSSQNIRRERRWIFTCSCQTHKVSTRMKNKIRSTNRYRCRDCKSDLIYKGLAHVS